MNPGTFFRFPPPLRDEPPEKISTADIPRRIPVPEEQDNIDEPPQESTNPTEDFNSPQAEPENPLGQ